MGYEKLQIKQVSKSGDIQNLINCFSGQVTVFRANDPRGLVPFQNILSGRKSLSNYVITLDNEPFNPVNHNLIGFGPQQVSGDISTIDFLLGSGISPNIAHKVLVPYGLEHLAQKKVGQLSRCEATRLCLLAGVYNKDKVLILNNPFDPIEFEWREPFAELIAGVASSNSLIVVVTSLSVRPECWIENPQICRVQVDDNRRKTIGFGGGGADLNMLVRQLRHAIKEEKKYELDPAQDHAAPDAESTIITADKDNRLPGRTRKLSDFNSLKNKIPVKIPVHALSNRKSLASLAVVMLAVVLYSFSGSGSEVDLKQKALSSKQVSGKSPRQNDKPVARVVKRTVSEVSKKPSSAKSAVDVSKIKRNLSVKPPIKTQPPVVPDKHRKITDNIRKIKPEPDKISPPLRKSYALDQYSVDIKKSIMAAFNQHTQVSEVNFARGKEKPRVQKNFPVKPSEGKMVAAFDKTRGAPEFLNALTSIKSGPGSFEKGKSAAGRKKSSLGSRSKYPTARRAFPGKIKSPINRTAVRPPQDPGDIEELRGKLEEIFGESIQFNE
jgi:hypothetical protein